MRPALLSREEMFFREGEKRERERERERERNKNNWVNKIHKLVQKYNLVELWDNEAKVDGNIGENGKKY